MKQKRDWLNNFFEKNAWGILVAMIGLVTVFTLQRSQVSANTDKIKELKDAVIQMTIIQGDIIKLQANQANMEEDVAEIKGDVKTLLQR